MSEPKSIAAQPPAGAEGEYYAERIHEVMADGDGFWTACSGCQESVDGCVSTTDYPYSKTFKCHPGGGCGECGGIGVIWDTTDYAEMGRYLSATPAQPDTGDVAALREALGGAVCALASIAGLAQSAVKPSVAALSKPNAPGTPADGGA